ncbi:trafficking protein particle complex 9 [Nesidiocoris tenuis]|uniref:Trafficking protein particle complex 9 n=1 Tax=Nesidiocoris tenuis TaxID=355587 RepID=A0ABN7AJN3_9HEMI|nr:trafficking protein particle complex 9 [Nesidiocoris tenuis]
MRSAVSVILSSPLPDPNMSHPDYEQTYHHHANLLILVKHVGEELSAKNFNKIFDRISRVNSGRIVDSGGVTRNIWARYIKDYPVGNNDWGDFQTHRRLLGLITVGKCGSQKDMDELCRVHESLKVRYNSTLYDTRCIMYGALVENQPSSESEGGQLPTVAYTPPSNFKSRGVYFGNEADPESPALEDLISEFISSLFWVLESKRHERSREKIDKVSLLLAPFEKKDFVGLDMESRSNKKRCVGRMTKHLGDLCLQAGLAPEALNHYHAAVETLRSINDLLWLGSACEGLSAASMCVRFPNLHKVQSVQRNTSLQETNKARNSNPKGNQGSEPGSSNLQVHSLPNNVLSNDEICKNYRESIIHYSKYQHAGVIEVEVCFKAARVAIELNMVIQTASFLQNIIFITLSLPEEEKIRKLMTLSELYGKIGFQRKASFYQRLAATKYVSARNPQTNWDQCYHLMLQSLSGHRLSLDPSEYPAGGNNGWGRLQKQVLQDVVVAAKRVGHSSLATRHMTLLLQVMWSELTPQERHESAQQLQVIAAQCEGSPIPLVLDTGLVIPPANLIHIPTAESFVVHELKPNLQPLKLDKIKEDYGPFLFTPLKLKSQERKPGVKDKLNYLWVAEEEGQVEIELTNPLQFELEVSNMRLLTTGVVFETLPLTVTLPPDVQKYMVTLTGTPKEVGELEIKGYLTHTLGVKSNCRLKYLPKISRPQFTIEVVPALPYLEASLNIGSSKDRSGSTIFLYAGESAHCNLVLENVGRGSVEFIEITSDCDSSVVHVDIENLPSQLPLPENGKISVPVTVFAAGNFMNSFPAVDSTSVKSSVMSGTNLSSLSSLRPGQYSDYPSTTPTPSFRSGPSSLSSLTSQMTQMKIDHSSKGTIEFHLKVKYSGKPGMDAGYCRLATVTLNLEVSNSIQISNWDVLPAETSNQFYLVLDVVNLTNQEVEIQYTANKSILIEENESCRVPIPIDRCPLSKIGKFFQSEDSLKEVVDLNVTCSDHIASLVDVKWVMGDRRGVASLKGITLSSHMLDVVRMSPILWEISVNDEDPNTNGTSPYAVSIGECVQIRVVARNALTRPLTNLSLSVLFFQDYQNGTCNYNLEGKLATTGPSYVSLPMVAELGAATMECCTVFFYPGEYKMSVQCNSQGRHTWKQMPPLEFDVQDVA